MRLLLLALMPVMMLWQSCGSTQLMEKIDRLTDDISVVAGRVKTVSDKLPEMKAEMDKKLDAARAELAAKGAPVDGTPQDLVKWGAQNPGSALGSIGAFLAVLAAAIAKYRTSKTATRALTASVDAVESMDPASAAAFKAAAASSTNMGAAEAALIASLKAR